MVDFGVQPPRLKSTTKSNTMLSSNLSQMARQVSHFYSAVELLGFSSQLDSDDPRHLELFSSWKMIAAREGALRLADFEDAMEGANEAVKDLTGEKCIWAGQSPFKMLRTYFPHIDGIRTASAHLATPMKNEAKRKEHASKTEFTAPGIRIGGGGEVIIGQALLGQRFVSSWKGKFAEYNVSMESVANLEEVKAAFYAGLPKSLLA